MSSKQTVAVLGAGGTIGFGIAQNLAKAGLAVRAWNRTRAKAEALSGDGAELFDTPAEAVAGADVIITILFDADATREVMFDDEGAAVAVTGDPLWVQMATIGAQATADCAELASKAGLRFVDAPVVGTKAPALQGKLTVLASGDPALESTLAPVFDALGQKTIWVGEVGRGTALKLVVNSWISSIVEGVAESFALAEGLGLDPQLLLDAVAGGPLDPGYLALKGKAILERDFEPSFTLSGGAKDTQLIADVIEREALDLPVLLAIRDRWAQGAKEHGDQDMIATFLTSAPKG